MDCNKHPSVVIIDAHDTFKKQVMGLLSKHCDDVVLEQNMLKESLSRAAYGDAKTQDCIDYVSRIKKLETELKIQLDAAYVNMFKSYDLGFLQTDKNLEDTTFKQAVAVAETLLKS